MNEDQDNEFDYDLGCEEKENSNHTRDITSPKTAVTLTHASQPVNLPAVADMPKPEEYCSETAAKKSLPAVVDSMIKIATDTGEKSNPLAAVTAGRYLIDEATGRNRKRLERGSGEELVARQVLSISQKLAQALVSADHMRKATVIDVSGPKIEKG